MKKIVIFLGPSLPVSEAKKILNAIYLSPAKQSDLMSAVTTYKPDIIGLIDGVFFNSLSVWHKEILYAIEQGIAVYGASSMGALRAAETAAFGMVGIGKVYEMYASEEIIDDDEVALIHGPEETEYRPLSEAMVNVRATLRYAKEEGILSQSLYEQLLALAKSIYFPERTFSAIFRKAASVGILPEKLDEVVQFVKKHYVNIKRQDAILLLQTLRDRLDGPSQVKPNFTLAQNHLFTTLYNRDRTVLKDNTTISFGDIAEYVALHSADFDDTNFNALNRALVQVLANILEIKISQEDIDKEIKRFRLKYYLNEDLAFTNWLDKNDLTLQEFNRIMSEIANCRHLQKWLIGRKAHEKNVGILINELRLQNRYEKWANATVKQEQIFQDNCPDFTENNYDNVTMSELVIEHLRSTDCRMNINYVDWASEAGCIDINCLKMELLRSRLTREVLQKQAINMVNVKPISQD
ncbi:TfuA-related McrA-glycine thioamidation protein [Nostoc sp. C117]|uniref:TfuA-related McrA-glycine thioamidation protein n=1 Tax=Nostoc sp. C117 TaxID=3349875 RepID=UPI00370D7DF2